MPAPRLACASVVHVDHDLILVAVRGVVGHCGRAIDVVAGGRSGSRAGNPVAHRGRGGGIAPDGAAGSGRGSKLVGHLIGIGGGIGHGGHDSCPCGIAVGGEQPDVVRGAVGAGHAEGGRAGDGARAGRHRAEIEIIGSGRHQALGRDRRRQRASAALETGFCLGHAGSPCHQSCRRNQIRGCVISL